MPSGITHGVYDGTEMDVHKYVERVARQMTDFIHMRDEPRGSKLTKRNMSSDYYRESLDKALARRDDWDSKSQDQHFEDWKNYAAEQDARRAEQIRKNDELSERYDKMIEQVESLDWPVGLEYGKEYALKYLREGQDFDVYDTETIEKFYATLSFDEWSKSTKDKIRRDINYYTEQIEETLIRDAQFNEKIDLWSKVVGYEIQ